MCAWAFAKVALRDAQLLNRFADEALRKYAELNGQNVPLSCRVEDKDEYDHYVMSSIHIVRY